MCRLIVLKGNIMTSKWCLFALIATGVWAWACKNHPKLSESLYQEMKVLPILSKTSTVSKSIAFNKRDTPTGWSKNQLTPRVVCLLLEWLTRKFMLTTPSGASRQALSPPVHSSNLSASRMSSLRRAHLAELKVTWSIVFNQVSKKVLHRLQSSESVANNPDTNCHATIKSDNAILLLLLARKHELSQQYPLF